MALEIKLHRRRLSLTVVDEERIRHHLHTLERRLARYPDPLAEVTLTPHPMQRQMQVDLRVRLGPLGAHLISHQQAETVDHAVERAVDDVTRQLERHVAMQEGEPSFGVPSRRETQGQRHQGKEARPGETGEE